ncbi:MAG: hypothetical protein HY962_00665 [Ignavibacteriae bacterium]|nr:hypothetical protein [Ignavibacteriota bacterium]
MYHSIEEFLEDWRNESGATKKLFSVLTDASLKRQVNDSGRSLGRLAWHITTSIPEMGGKTGLSVQGPGEDSDVPDTAIEINTAYAQAADSLAEAVGNTWNDNTLLEERNMYGETWSNKTTLAVLVRHQIHHRAQMTILMRQAGLIIPGLYGPSKEEWVQFGMPPQE